jgi:uncharacterized protein (TIGR02594 family)
MRLTGKRATILLCSVAVALLASPAIAKRMHKAHRHSAAQVSLETPDYGDARTMKMIDPRAAATARRHHRRAEARAQVAEPSLSGDRLARARALAQSHSNSAPGGFTTNSLVTEARKYIGTNPTGRGSLWCGAFMDLVLRRTGHKGGGNLAWGYEHYGTRVAGPQVGAIAVMGRRGGGHVGVVSGIDANGNPIIVSGNHNHTVAESVYPRSRIAAYVLPAN